MREEWQALATTRRSKAITRALAYLETHAHRMRDVTLRVYQLPSGSGPVESAVRRVGKRRCKVPGAFWREPTVRGLMPLGAAVKAGRWDEIRTGGITDEGVKLSV